MSPNFLVFIKPNLLSIMHIITYIFFKEFLLTSLISLNRTDRLRLIGFDENFDSNIIRDCLGEIQNVRDYHGSVEFKLKGHPFHCSGKEAVKTRRTINKVLVSFEHLLSYFSLFSNLGDITTLWIFSIDRN